MCAGGGDPPSCLARLKALVGVDWRAPRRVRYTAAVRAGLVLVGAVVSLLASRWPWPPTQVLASAN
ncbi:hypothetical protein [Streptomyces silvisoli]|uniref:Uncharacterized protein n=1 Tax=Streptomyces silvisoli TaxID=3034235 RepID=A0ABT5ZDK5_9ACTN|nr:hypothetical protein [Streptomyces silvisoli]MDF3287915.1 hypothetical protein [Streptomyces silvisoli]